MLASSLQPDRVRVVCRKFCGMRLLLQPQENGVDRRLDHPAAWTTNWIADLDQPVQPQ